MRQIDPKKEKSMVARMAGNIVGPILAASMKDLSVEGKQPPDDMLEVMAIMAVTQACAILDAIESRIPCGKCDECGTGSQCREVGTGVKDGG